IRELDGRVLRTPVNGDLLKTDVLLIYYYKILLYYKINILNSQQNNTIIKYKCNELELEPKYQTLHALDAYLLSKEEEDKLISGRNKVPVKIDTSVSYKINAKNPESLKLM
ncbi:17139_t:CDS:2, partial [Funneliformis geosporum]